MKKHGASIVIFVLLFAITSALQIAGNAFHGERLTYGDESPHYLNSVVIRDYIAHGKMQDPMAFAVRYYSAYPKIALFVWPPFFHAALAAFMLLTGLGETKALIFMALCSTGTAFLVYECLRRQGWPLLSSLTPALILVLLPTTQKLNTVVMQESLLALLSFCLAWQLALFVERPTMRNAIVYGLLGAAAGLTKGNSFAVFLAVPMVLLLTNRIRLLRHKEIYIAGAITAALSIVPFAIEIQWLRNSNEAPRVGYKLGIIFNAITFYAHELQLRLGWVALTLIVAGMVMAFARDLRTRNMTEPGRTVRVSMFCSVLAILLFYSFVVTHAKDWRYLYPAFPMMFFFLPEAGAWIARRWPLPSAAPLVNVAALLAFVLVDFHLERVTPGGFAEALATVRRDAGDAPLRVLISSDDRGEGAFTVRVADTDVQRHDTVIRASKLLGISDWQATRVRVLYSDAAQVTGKIERLGIRYLVFDRTAKMNDQFDNLLQGSLKLGPQRFLLIGDISSGVGCQRHLEVYRVVKSANPPLEILEFKLPYSSNIIGDRAIRQ